MFRVWLALDMNLPLAEVGRQARRAEALGCDVVTLADVACDAFLGAQAAIEATSRVQVATSGLVCFARSPMVTAQLAWDLQNYSGGRFALGIGTQIKGHNERRYATPWPSAPGPRMREYVLCLRAMFRSFQNPRAPEYRKAI